MPSGPGLFQSCILGVNHARSIDLTVIVAYLAGITWFGARFRKASTPSAITSWAAQRALVGHRPVDSFGRDQHADHDRHARSCRFPGNSVSCRLGPGYLLARIVIALAVSCRIFPGRNVTAYELMRRRFGSASAASRRHVPGAARVGRGRPRGGHFPRRSQLSLGPAKKRLHRGDLCLTLFYTYEGGHNSGYLDSRRPDDPVCGGRGPQFRRNPASDSRAAGPMFAAVANAGLHKFTSFRFSFLFYF